MSPSTVTQPTPSLLTNIGGFKGMAIVSRKNVESGQIATHPVGTGPFVFVVSKSGDSITLKANPNYWGGAPAVSGVTFRFISEPGGRVGVRQVDRGGDADRAVEPDAGAATLGDANVFGVRGASEKALRRRISLALQDPFTSLDPRMRIGTAIAEPLVVHRLADGRRGRRKGVGELLDTRRPGRRTRVAISA